MSKTTPGLQIGPSDMTLMAFAHKSLLLPAQNDENESHIFSPII
jgi:hypothetical protein